MVKQNFVRINDVKLDIPLPEVDVVPEWAKYDDLGKHRNDFVVLPDPLKSEDFITGWDSHLKDGEITVFSQTGEINWAHFIFWTGFAALIKKNNILGGMSVATPLAYFSSDSATKEGMSEASNLEQLISFFNFCSSAQKRGCYAYFNVTLWCSKDYVASTDSKTKRVYYMRTLSNLVLRDTPLVGDLVRGRKYSPNDKDSGAVRKPGDTTRDIPVILSDIEFDNHSATAQNYSRPTAWTRLINFALDKSDGNLLSDVNTVLEGNGFHCVYVDSPDAVGSCEAFYFPNPSDIFDESKNSEMFELALSKRGIPALSDFIYIIDKTVDIAGIINDKDRTGFREKVETISEFLKKASRKTTVGKKLQSVKNMISKQTGDEEVKSMMIDEEEAPKRTVAKGARRNHTKGK